MSHEVESMLYVGGTPWHKLGIRLDNPPTVAEAIRIAGLDWEVGLKDLVTVDGEAVTHKATYRVSDGRVLGVVGPTYAPLQNGRGFTFFDPFLSAGEATIETAGSLRGGARVWMLARLNRDPVEIVPGDAVHKYILLANSHDGTFATRVGFTPIRVVCANTLSMATHAGASRLLRVRHTKGAEGTLAAIRDTMNLANAQFEATAEQYRGLAARQVNAADLEKYVRIVFGLKDSAKRAKPAEQWDADNAPTIKELPPCDDEAPTFHGARLDGSSLDSVLDAQFPRPLAVPSLAEVVDETEKDRASRCLSAIIDLFETGTGNTLPGVRGTLWAAYNAVTEYTTHHRGRSAENRLNSQFSDGLALNQRALTEAIKLAAA